MYIVTTTNTFQTNFTLDDKVVLHLSLIGVGGNPDKIIGRTTRLFQGNGMMKIQTNFILDDKVVFKNGVMKIQTNFKSPKVVHLLSQNV